MDATTQGLLTLYFSPGACSFASHIAAEESGLTFRAVEANTQRGETRSDTFLSMNPLGRVPVLVLQNGAVVTENPAILTYLADAVPNRNLLPPFGSLARARAEEWLAFLSNSVHVAFRAMFRPERLVGPDEEMIFQVRKIGIVALGDLLAEADRRLENREHVLGDAYSVCDGYLTVFGLWSQRVPLKEHLPVTSNIARISRKTMERQAVVRVLAREQEVSQSQPSKKP